MVLYGAVWCYTVLYGAIRCCMVLYGAVWCYTVLYGAVWCYTVLYGAIRCCMVLYGAVWCYTVLYGAVQCYTALYVLYGAVQCYTALYVLYGAVQCCTVLYGAVQCYTVLYSAIRCCTVLYGAMALGSLLNIMSTSRAGASGKGASRGNSILCNCPTTEHLPRKLYQSLGSRAGGTCGEYSPQRKAARSIREAVAAGDVSLQPPLRETSKLAYDSVQRFRSDLPKPIPRTLSSTTFALYYPCPRSAPLHPLTAFTRYNLVF